MMVDYKFRIDDILKFFLEAKGLDEDLEGPRMVNGGQVTYAEQAKPVRLLEISVDSRGKLNKFRL